MTTASPAGNTEVSVIISNPPTPESISNSNLSPEGLYVPDFNQVYIRGDQCIAPNQRRKRCGRTNVSTKEELDEIKPWDEKTEEQKVLHRFCTGH